MVTFKIIAFTGHATFDYFFSLPVYTALIMAIPGMILRLVNRS